MCSDAASYLQPKLGKDTPRGRSGLLAESDSPCGFSFKPLEAVTVVEWLPETLDSDEHSREAQHSLRVCETCAERGRPNEPVYKMGMCEFCYKGLPHPKATREQLITETRGQRPPRSKSSLE